MPGVGRAFEAARREHRGAFIAYLASGYPDLAESDRLAAAACDAGADVLELGVPFSDPVADGPVIQRATQVALEGGATLASVIRQAATLRAAHATPIVLMSYLNPIHRYGVERFARDAAASGVDGVILVDLPPEEDPETWETMVEAGLDTIALVTPTSAAHRLPAIASRSRGFVYVVARLGVTGAGAADPDTAALLDRCRALSPLPRAIGFGMSLESDLAPYRGRAEGVIVGSGLLQPMLGEPDAAARERGLRERVRAFRKKVEDLGGA
ncbi:MAG TPA: tryptophan synthase subunit alpha [Candidatus Eisenbacteria bacterium]|nr:tryptophan synthase subunit alpha [Candidatus Eisenbacteria bacterium]